MPSHTLELHNRAELAQTLTDETWVVACLCAAWCDVCRQYRSGFEGLAAEFPDAQFVWIDIEDQADLVGDIDIDNFPTLLIQRGDTVAFFGTILPDVRQTARLLQAQAEKSEADLQAEIAGNAERQGWQEEANLRCRLVSAQE
jgi:thioredoxin 1